MTRSTTTDQRSARTRRTHESGTSDPDRSSRAHRPAELDRMPTHTPDPGADVRATDTPDPGADVRATDNPFLLQFSLNEQIWYQWLFSIRFEMPLDHSNLPFSIPIPQDVNQ